jgi:hypothetical protein
MKKIITMAILSLPLFSFDYMEECTVPNIIIKTVQITENEISYPYLIRANSKLDLFNTIVERYTYNKTKDKNVIDCINKDNCISIANSLIENKIINIDLGLHQINYDSYQKPIYRYFDTVESAKSACEVIEDKTKKGWTWEDLAKYYSKTPSLNKIYKEKLIKNYLKLLAEQQ